MDDEIEIGPPIFPSPTLEAVLFENGYLDGFVLPDGSLAALLLTVASQGQIIRAGFTQVEGVHERWTYRDLGLAISAFISWRMDVPRSPEPEGWLRHQPSNRRRTYVDGRHLWPLEYDEEVRP